MKKMLSMFIILSLTGCSASIGPQPSTRVYSTTPAVSSTTYTTPVSKTTVTETNY